MRKKKPYTYFLIFFALLAVMSLPKHAAEKLQGSTIAFLAPTWEHVLAIKTFLFGSSQPSQDSSLPYEELEKLRIENNFLQTEIIRLKEMMQYELKLLNQLQLSQNTCDMKTTTSLLKKRHRLELQNLLQLQLQAIPARIIFRSPASWNSSFWINVGSSTNEGLNTQVIAKNSPVLVGTSVIGVVDYVGKKQSRVRLITDSGLNPSVRALREDCQHSLLIEKIQHLLYLFEDTKNILEDHEEQGNLLSLLEKASEHLSKNETGLYLAKGEIHGSSKPLWRTQRHQLQGIGFNYDHADGEGSARDLRTGKPLDPSNTSPSIPILKKGDILVTTGMDGVFPPDLLIAEVIAVHLLKEGDYYYEIDALPIAGNLDNLKQVFVIPPVGYNPDDHP